MQKFLNPKKNNPPPLNERGLNLFMCIDDFNLLKHTQTSDVMRKYIRPFLAVHLGTVIFLSFFLLDQIITTQRLSSLWLLETEDFFLNSFCICTGIRNGWIAIAKRHSG